MAYKKQDNPGALTSKNIRKKVNEMLLNTQKHINTDVHIFQPLSTCFHSVAGLSNMCDIRGCTHCKGWCPVSILSSLSKRE